MFRIGGDIDVYVGNEPNRDAPSATDLGVYCEIAKEIGKQKGMLGLRGRLLGFRPSTDDCSVVDWKKETGIDPFRARRVSEFLNVAKERRLFDALDGVVVNVYPRSRDSGESVDYGWYEPEKLLLDWSGNRAYLAEVIERAKAQSLPLYVLETGSVSNCEDGKTTGSEEKQAILAVRSLLSAWMAGSRAVCYYELRDTDGRLFGLYNTKGEDKLAAISIRKLLVELDGFRIVSWSHLRNDRFRMVAKKGDASKVVSWSTGKGTREFPVNPVDGIVLARAQNQSSSFVDRKQEPRSRSS